MSFWLVRAGSVGAALLGALAIGALAEGVGGTAVRLIALAGLYVTLAVSLNLINGITGQFSIGHAAFYLVGAYAGAWLTTQIGAATGGTVLFAAWPVIVLSGMAFAALAGLLIGLPSLRLKGDYLAIVTLGFGEIMIIVVQNAPALGGAYGMNLPKLEWIPGIWLLAFLCIAVTRNLLKTAHGLTFLSVREDEIASGAMGVHVTRTKVAAFVIGSAFAGGAGALYALNEGFVNPNSFRMDVSFIVLTMVVLGGTGSITGSTLAAILLFALPEVMRDLPPVPLHLVLGLLFLIGGVTATVRQSMLSGDRSKIAHGLGWAVTAGVAVTVGSSFLPALSGQMIEAARLRMVIFAVALVVVMLLRPQGIFGHHEFSWAWLRRCFARSEARA